MIEVLLMWWWEVLLIEECPFAIKVLYHKKWVNFETESCFNLYKEMRKCVSTLSIHVFTKLWDTELLCKEYAKNYWLTRVPVDSSHTRRSVNGRWNYLSPVLIDLSPGVYPSTVAETIWIESQSSVLRPTQKLLTHTPAVCPLTGATSNNSRSRRLSSNCYRN